MKFTKITKSSAEGQLEPYFKGWLEEKYPGHYAQISVRTTLRLKSAAKDVARALLGAVPPDIERLCKKFQMPPQGVDDIKFIMGYNTDEGWQQGSIETDQALKEYISKYPKHWEIVKNCLSLPRQIGKHACAYLISNTPIAEKVPLTTVEGVKVTAFTGPEVEGVGGLKMDFLVINVLNDIRACIKMVRERHPNKAILDTPFDHIPTKVGFKSIWDLPEDLDVFQDISSGRTETVFQFSTEAAKRWLKFFDYKRPDGTPGINSIKAMAEFTALDRPGPLDYYVSNGDNPSEKHNALVEYSRRIRGLKGSPDILPVLEQFAPNEKGILIFQETLQATYQYLTGCSGYEAEEFRKNVAKKKKDKIEKAYTFFMEKATEKVGQEKAQGVWDSLLPWSSYGFTKSIDKDTVLELCDGTKKKIEDVIPGEKIYCLNENGEKEETEIVDLHDHGYLYGYEVEFESGYKIVCSQNHKFLTEYGQQPLWKILQENLKVARECDGVVLYEKIVNWIWVGMRRMYDIEVASPTHNFILPGGIVTSNSHATSYVFVSYACAYLKHHFPLEWWCGVLQNATKEEIATKFWPYCNKIVDLPSLKNANLNFAIVGERIQAPLSLLNGIGETAHKQLCKYAPYGSVEDIAKAIVQHQKDNQVDGKWGRSAINIGTIYTLAAAGVMDSVLPEKLTVPEIMDLYQKALKAEALKNGKKTSGKLKKYVSPDALQRYQLIKKILPVYSIDFQDLVPLQNGLERGERGDLWYTYTGYDRNGNPYTPTLQVLTGKQLEEIWDCPEIPMNGYRCAVLSYIEKADALQYQNKTKTAKKFTIDACGLTREVVQWPDDSGSIGTAAEKVNAGCIAIFVLTKRSADKGWSIRHIQKIADDFKEKEE